MDTGKGFVFVDINSDYNQEGFSNPTSVAFPLSSSLDPELELELEPLVVGSRKRRFLGSRPPESHHYRTPPRVNREAVNFATPQAWLALPQADKLSVHPKIATYPWMQWAALAGEHL